MTPHNTKVKRPWNTKEKGLMEFVVFHVGTNYTGVCLTFDIIEEGKDMEAVEKSVKEAAKLHLKVVTEKNLPDELLNRYAPQKYWDIYAEGCRYLYAKEIESSMGKNPRLDTFQKRYAFNNNDAVGAKTN